MDKEELKARTKRFALRVLDVVDELPRTVKGRVAAQQLVRCGTSVGTNYRAALRARSKAEYISKLQTVLEESDETHYWLELCLGAGLLASQDARDLCAEADELTAIFNSTLFRLRHPGE